MQVTWSSPVNLKLKLWILAVSKTVVLKHTNQVIGTNYERGRAQNEKCSLKEIIYWMYKSKPDSANGTSVAA